MCLGVNSDCDDDAQTPMQIIPQGADTVDWIYGNSRGLRQGCGDFRKTIASRRPTFFAVNETHLDGDASSAFIPFGYKQICRLDRSIHGGGLMLGSKKHLLVDTLDLKAYNQKGIAEQVGIEWEGTHWILYYTPNSYAALTLLKLQQQYKEDHPGVKVVFIGDMNVHNDEWICSASATDPGGLAAQEFCELFGMNQLVHFPTRGDNTLDIVLSDIIGEAKPIAGFGNSDHIAISITFAIGSGVPPTPIKHKVRDWHNAPWLHIKGDIKRKMHGWKPTGTVDEAEAEMDKKLNDIIDTHVKWKSPARPGPTPWWNKACEQAYKWKHRCFECRSSEPDEYDRAVKTTRKIQRKAYKSYQKKIRSKLNGMSSSDRNFWQLTKEIGGLSTEKGNAAPSVDDLASHFAEKMSNGKEEPEDEFFIPKDAKKVPLSNFKIRLKTVKKVLLKMDPNKSSNGIPQRFWKECADILAKYVCRLYQFIVQKAKYPAKWKYGRVTALHKRESVRLSKNYRPVQVMVSISLGFESTVDEQFTGWMTLFIPESQFGFLVGFGTEDYGCVLTFKMVTVLEQRREGILVSMDVKGAFDRVWWGRIKARLKKKGLRRRALALIRHYLYKRFLWVVNNGKCSEFKELFSSVPQGGKWSAPFWNFDISEMEAWISALGELICYADDSGLWYEITAGNRDHIIEGINKDLQGLMDWGDDNKTLFEADKTAMMLVSNKRHRFDISGIQMGGFPVEQVKQLKLVGYLFDEKMSFGPMIQKIAKKARCRVAALRRIKHLLDAQNLKLLYTMFVRSMMEYGCIAFMGAAKSHLEKLDRIQNSASKCCGFQIESLQSRREAAAAGLALKLMDGGGHPKLKPFAPNVAKTLSLSRKRTRTTAEASLQLERLTKTTSLGVFERSFLGCIPQIWRKIPHNLIEEGKNTCWLRIKKRVKLWFTGKHKETKAAPTQLKKVKQEQCCSTKLNQELNAQDTDWMELHLQLKHSGISLKH